MVRSEKLSIAQLQAVKHFVKAKTAHCAKLWSVMSDCIDQEAATGQPGGLSMKHRASTLWNRLLNNSHGDKAPANAAQRAMVYAMAVNEKNAAGGHFCHRSTSSGQGLCRCFARISMSTSSMRRVLTVM